MASRMQVAQHLADTLEQSRPAAVQQAAAWLANAGRSRQARYLARDVASILARRGYVLVRITTARPLSGDARSKLELMVRELTKAKQLELDFRVEPTLVGGAIIATPDAEMDLSVRTKLARYVDNATSSTARGTSNGENHE